MKILNIKSINIQIDKNNNATYKTCMMLPRQILAVITSVIVLLSLSSCNAINADNEECRKYEYAQLEAYPGLEDIDNQHIYEMQVRDVCRKMDEKNTFAVLFSHAECPYCKACLQIIYRYLEEEGQELGYVDCRKDPSWRSNLLMEDYDLLEEHLGEYFPLDDLERRHLYVPHVFFIKDGEAVYQYSGAAPTFKSTQKNMTESEIHFLLGKYDTGFSLLGDSEVN